MDMHTVTHVSGTRIPSIQAEQVAVYNIFVKQNDSCVSFQPFFHLGTPEQSELIESFGTWQAGHNFFSLLLFIKLWSEMEPFCNQFSVLSSFMDRAGSHKPQEAIWWSAIHLICEGQFNMEIKAHAKSKCRFVDEY